MNLLASFALGGFNPWAAGFGIGSLVLFGLVGLVAIWILYSIFDRKAE